MMNMIEETRKRCSFGLRMYVTATHPAKAIAACPDGSPPRRGVPRPTNALVAMTTSTVSTSAISVTSVGRSRRRSRTLPADCPIACEKTRYPTAIALTDAIRTAPAAMSFASLASGSKDVVATSIACSIAELIISATSTNAIESSSAISSNRFTPAHTAPTITPIAIAKWMRMLRCVRRTWISPSIAKLKLSIRFSDRRRLIARISPRGLPSRRRGRSRAGAAVRAPAARARPRPSPAGRAPRHRAAGGRRPGAGRARRSGTRARRSPRRSRDAGASARGSPPEGRTRCRAPRSRPPRPRAPAAPAPRPPARRPRCRFGSRPRSRPRSPRRTVAARRLGMAPVRLDDPLDELVADDVLVPEADERDPLDRPEDVLHGDEPRGLVARKVDLRHVAGHDDPRPEAEPRQEHLHLLRARVLGLVEDDERVVQGAAAHERERRHLDRAFLHVRGQPVGVEHVVERVEQRPQVRVDLRQDVAREKSEPLAGLDRGPGEDDPPDFPLRQRPDREGHGQIGLARPGRADGERDRVLPDRVDVELLVDRLRRDLLAAVPPDHVLEDLADVVRLVDRADHGVDRSRPDLVPALDQLDELVDHGPGLRDVHLLALDRQPVAAEQNRAVEPVAERVEHAVADRGELGGHVVRDVEDFLHSSQCRAEICRNRSTRCARIVTVRSQTGDGFLDTIASGRRSGVPTGCPVGTGPFRPASRGRSG